MAFGSRSGGRSAEERSQEQLSWSGLEGLEPRLMLAGDFAVTVTSIAATTNLSPALSGTCDNAGATVIVTVAGKEYTATRDSATTWKLAAGRIGAGDDIADLVEGTYDVLVEATNAATGLKGTDSSTGELVIDKTAPTVTITATSTADTRPSLSGTWDDANGISNVKVTVNGVTYTATVDQDNKTWVLADNAISSALTQRLYDVRVVATDKAGQTGEDTTTDELTIVQALTLSTNDLTTNIASPKLSGKVNDKSAVVTVNVNGVDYTAKNNKDGTWALAAGKLPELADGTYQVTVTAEVGEDTLQATADLTISQTITQVAVDAGDNLNPATRGFPLKGTFLSGWDKVTVQFEYDVNVYNATISGTTWTVTTGATRDDTARAYLEDGTYDLILEATNSDGDVVRYRLNDILVVDAKPVVAVASLKTIDTTPELTGTIDDPTAAIRVTITSAADSSRTWSYDAINNGDADRGITGTWTLPNDVISALSPGSYSLKVVATDTAQHASDQATGTLTLGITVSVVTIVTTDTRPELTGEVDDPDATVKITITGPNSYNRTFTAVNDGVGGWKLADNVIPALHALTNGVYAVKVEATNNSSGMSGSTPGTGALTVDTAGPAVTINSITPSVNRSPRISGSLSDVSSIEEITVEVDGQIFKLSEGEVTYDTASKSWSLAAGMLLGLKPGAYDVIVTATDSQDQTQTDTTVDELIINIGVTLTDAPTNETKPTLGGTIDLDMGDAQIQVTIDGVAYDAVNVGDGTWTFDGSQLPDPLTEGSHSVTVRATLDEATGSANGDVVVDLEGPTVTVDTLTTNDPTPEITGTVSDSAALIELTINGQTFDSENDISVDEDGNWRLLAAAWEGRTPLALGTYDVLVTVTDEAGNPADDTTADELVVVDVPQVGTMVTKDTTPRLTGTIWLPANMADLTALEVVVNGQTFTRASGAVTLNTTTGGWTLLDNRIAELDDGVYDVTVTATVGGVDFVDTTSGELTIDTEAPTVTVDSLITTRIKPQLTGTVSDPQNISELTVQVAGGTIYTLSTGVELDRTTGVWVLPAGTATVSGTGLKEVKVTATDTGGNVTIDSTTNELDMRSQTVVTLSGYSRTVMYTDPDGTKVKIRVDKGQMAHQITMWFDSDSVITSNKKNGNILSKYVLKSAAGITLESMEISAGAPGIAISAGGGRVSGATIEFIGGNGHLDSLSAANIDLGSGVGPAISMTSGIIDNVTLRSIKGDVNMGGVAKGSGVAFNVARTVTDSDITLPASSVRSFSVGQMVNSTLLAGVTGPTDSATDDDNTYDLPTLVQLKDGYRISSVNIRGIRGVAGPNFVNSNIASDAINNVSILGGAKLDNDGLLFGLTTNELGSLKLTQAGVAYTYGENWDLIDVLDLTVRTPTV